MATNDVQVFNSLPEAIGDGRIDLDNDTLKLAIITSAITPTAAGSSWNSQQILAAKQTEGFYLTS